MHLEVLDMALTKIKLGKLISISEDKNTDGKYGINNVKGISIQKKFIETKADMDGVSLKPYLLVKPEDFAYVTVTSRNGEKITLAHNTTDETYIVSSSYVVFRIIRKDILLPEYLFMYFNRSEFDRYSRFNSWGSARETFSWEEMCDIDFELPSIEIQRKYVEIYKGMVDNQAAYETGLEDLKLVCDGYIDKLKNMNAKVKIGNYIEQIDNRNKHNLSYKFSGLSMENYFIESIADSNELDFSKYKIVQPNEYGAVLMKVGRDCRLTIARNTSQENLLISPAYYTFKTHDIMPEYFMANVNRSEFERRGWFSCDSSARGSLSWDLFANLEIPYVSEKDQRIISNLYSVMIERNEINNKLKQLIRNICPVLIKGAVEEAKRS